MFKNLTIGQITVFLTIFLVSLNTGIFVILDLTDREFHPSAALWISLIFISAVLSYYIIKYFLEKFVFRRIKLIYKIINDSKQSLTSGSSIVDIRSIEEVKNEVAAWAIKKEKEIQHLTGLEEYRKNYLGNISHELKTPLFSILGYLHTLLDGGINDDQINIKYLKRAVSNVERLQNIVDDLDIINKLESGGNILKMSNFDLKELVVEVMNDLEIMAKAQGIKIRHKEGASKKFLVSADKENIRQVLVNLITNAIKYGEDDGYIKVSYYDMDEKVLVEVSDDGIGIEEKHLNHLFDRFYRVDASRSRSRGGSGLGLAIVKHILEAHGQSINVRSTYGKGTTFGFTLDKGKKNF